MALGHVDSRRAARRVFQPTVDGRLESRMLLASSALRIQTAAGGQALVVTEANTQQFYVSVNQGTIQGSVGKGGRLNLVAKGTTSSTFLEINQIIQTHSQTSGAHTFNASLGAKTAILNVGSIKVTSGFIDAIEGYHDAVLSGPITVLGSAPVDRIAFTAINPGGSITVGQDLNTLEVLNSATFTTPPGLSVGRDLNWMDLMGNLTFEDGANMTLGRDLGLTAQPAKGSGLAGQGLFVNGNFTVTAPSSVFITRNIDEPGILINGNLTGASRFTVGAVKGAVDVLGTITP
jgi:hypothetical protein